VDNFNSDNSVIDSGNEVVYETDLNAPNKRIVTVDVNNPASNWLDFIPETENVPSTGGGFIFANYMMLFQ
jgi:prolyl oligopeptidase